MNLDQYYISHDWKDKPKNVHAYTTLTGVNVGGEKTCVNDYGDFNLATHVGDNLHSVELNRQRLMDDLNLPATPFWLDQIHSNHVLCADKQTSKAQLPPQADAVFSSDKNIVCAVLTADCLPVFFCNKAGSEVAVAHAGWRGLQAGILRKTVASMQSASNEIIAYLGPAIGSKAFEIGADVFSAFVENNEANSKAFIENRKGHYLCDIYELSRIELRSVGVNQISGGNFCTYSDERFYSYRRQKNTGRMASLIWLD